MARPLKRITLKDISDVLERNENGRWEQFERYGDASAYLSWRPEGHLKISLPDKGFVSLPIPWYRKPLTRGAISTPEGFLDVVDDTLGGKAYYLANVTFLGYAGLSRYPVVKGILYKGCGFSEKHA